MAKKLRMVDIDSHVIEPDDMWEKYLEPEFRSEMPHTWVGYEGDPIAFKFGLVVPSALAGAQYVMGSASPTGEAVDNPGFSEFLDYSNSRYADWAKKGFGPEVYKEALPEAGIEYMVLYPTVGLHATAVPTLSAATAAAFRRAYNRWQGDFTKAAGSRVIGSTNIDLRDPAEAAREVRFCTKEFGNRSVYANPTPVGNQPLFHESFEPLWDAMEELDVPLAFHGCIGSAAETITKMFLTGLGSQTDRGEVAFGIHYMMQLAALIRGGVLARHPKLRVGFMESGVGWAPWFVDRMDAGNQGGLRDLPHANLADLDPSDYYKRQCYIAAEQTDPGAAFYVQTFGSDNICLSTDFGHPEGRHYNKAIEEWMALPGLEMDVKEKAMWDNGLRLYGIQHAE